MIAAQLKLTEPTPSRFQTQIASENDRGRETRLPFDEMPPTFTDSLTIKAQQRVPLQFGNSLAILRNGVLAVDAMPTKGRLQVLDFLLPGDVLPISDVSLWGKVSLRAITGASLAVCSPDTIITENAQKYWPFLYSIIKKQVTRVNLHQLVIGRLESRARVASFLLEMAFRCEPALNTNIVALPMSRTDIANYLVINCDTLSRIMASFALGGLIERQNRNFVKIIDFNKLRDASPIAPLLSAVFEWRERNQGMVLI